MTEMVEQQNGSSQRGLSREAIVETALAVADEHGIDKVTVRRIATTLDVGTMSLYSYFRSKEDLLDAVADCVLGRFELPPTATAETPEEAIRAIAAAWRTTMRDHPSIVQMLLTRVTNSREAMRRALDAPIGRLVASGIPAELAIRCYGFLVVGAVGFFSYQQPRPWGHQDNDDQKELIRQRQHFYASLPMSEFPNLVAYSHLAVELPADVQYEFGIDCLVRSVNAELGL